MSSHPGVGQALLRELMTESGFGASMVVETADGGLLPDGGRPRTRDDQFGPDQAHAGVIAVQLGVDCRILGW